ncbi:hypothetical protein BgiMline_025687 [Biomphalaria glabrata]|nr:hypothetical protein BgiMline_021751 [Biomphalaria glabrata]
MGSLKSGHYTGVLGGPTFRVNENREIHSRGVMETKGKGGVGSRIHAALDLISVRSNAPQSNQSIVHMWHGIMVRTDNINTNWEVMKVMEVMEVIKVMEVMNVMAVIEVMEVMKVMEVMEVIEVMEIIEVIYVIEVMEVIALLGKESLRERFQNFLRFFRFF